MAYLLRAIILLTLFGILLVIASAHSLIHLPINHIHLAIPTFIFIIFEQSFVMFYFIGVSKFTENIHIILHTKTNLKEIFESPPEDLTPYIKKTNILYYEANLGKKQTTPWSILILVLGMIAFFLGAAHDTNLVNKSTHSGVVYGFLAATLIGSVRQWYYLGKSHTLLRKVKTLFSIPDQIM